jgi:hypothetical protein
MNMGRKCSTRIIAALLVGTGVFMDTIVGRSAYAVGTIWKIPYFSVHGAYIRNPDGTIWVNPITGEPKYEITFDPDPAEGVTSIGFVADFNPSQWQIDTDPSTYGFLCEFSDGGPCPSGAPKAPVAYGAPLPGSTHNFSIDNSAGKAVFSYFFSGTPVYTIANTDFFAFQLDPVGSIGPVFDASSLPVPTITQRLDDPRQFCKTTNSDPGPFKNDCGSGVPGPIPLLGVGAAFGFSRRLRRRIKATSNTAIIAPFA